MDFRLKVWRVSIGNLYYVQGLPRFVKKASNQHRNIELSTYKDAAWLFAIKEHAYELANAIEGTVEEVFLKEEELLHLRDTHIYHAHSENDWYAYLNKNETCN